VNIYLPLRIT